MRPEKRGNLNTSTLAVLMTFFIFAICIVSVLLSGAKVYSGVTKDSAESFSYRTCTSYFGTRLRRAENAQNISAESFDGCDCLVIAEEIEGDPYITRVYCYDGWLCELFTSAGGDFAPEDGQRLIEMDHLDVSVESGLLRLAFADGYGKPAELTFHLGEVAK